MLQKLQTSLLTSKHAQQLKIQPMTEREAAELGVSPSWAGFKIPYFTPEGAIDKGFFRYRFWPDSKPSSGFAAIAEPTRKLRYVQPKNTELHVYMPPVLSTSWRDIMNDAAQPLCITEGELKAACACVSGFTMLGLGGVFSWTSKKHQQPLIPILEEFVWESRDIYLCFDSDQTSNPLVQLAASRLALVLTARGAKVHDVIIPDGAGGAKQGVDDFMVARGAEAFEKLIEDAKPIGAGVELHRLNEEVGLLWSGGAAGHVVRLSDGFVMKPLAFTQSFYRDRTYSEFTLNAQGQPGTLRVKRAAEEWLGWRSRTLMGEITYEPGKPQITAEGNYNIWRSSGLEPIKGDISPWTHLMGHMFKDLRPEQFRWLEQWLAWPLQYLGAKMYSCVLLWSHTGGTGKNLLAEVMCLLYGPSNSVTIGSRELTAAFNGWAEGKQFVVGDEITLDDKRQTSNALKSMLTSTKIRVNRKGVESYEIDDRANYVLTSNDPLSVVQEQGARRTFIHQVNEEPYGDARGRALKKWASEGGAAHVLYHLVKEVDLSDFSPTAKPPDTDSFIDAVAYSRSDIDTWAVAVRADPDTYLTSNRAKFDGGKEQKAYDVYTPAELLKLYDPEDKKKVSLRALGIALDRAGFKKALYNNGRLGNIRSTFWLVRSTVNVTSTVAAKMYQQERGVGDKTASVSKFGKRVQ
jgi:hypothetical protein